MEYRINTIQKLYNDNYQDAKKYVMKSDKSRAFYYEVMSDHKWGDKDNYDLCLNCEIGNEAVQKIICEYIKNK